jgi:hypothetical protein
MQGALMLKSVEYITLSFPMVSLEFFSDIIIPVDSSSNRNEYQVYFLRGKGGRCVRLTTLPPPCTVVMKSGNLNFLEPSGPLQACNGTALPLLYFTVHYITLRNLISRKAHNRALRWYGHVEQMIEERLLNKEVSCLRKEEKYEEHLHIVTE